MSRKTVRQRALYRQQIRARQQAGLCVKCGTVPAAPGRTRCVDCITQARIRSAFWVARKQQRKICRRCPRPVWGNYTHCAHCRARRTSTTLAAWVATKHEDRIARGALTDHLLPHVYDRRWNGRYQHSLRWALTLHHYTCEASV